MKNKKYIIFIMCIIFLNLPVSGCAGTEKAHEDKVIKENDNSTLEKYKNFEKDYNKILENFKVEDFKEMGWEYREPAITFNEPCEIFTEENDMINNDVNKPIRKNIYYYNKKDKVLINITHIFINTSMGNHLLTSDYPRLEFEEVGITVPVYNEHFMCYGNTLVSLKTIYTGKKKIFL